MYTRAITSGIWSRQQPRNAPAEKEGECYHAFCMSLYKTSAVHHAKGVRVSAQGPQPDYVAPGQLLVDHDIRALLLSSIGLGLGWLRTIGGGWLPLIHLHVLVAAFALFALLLVVIALGVFDVDLFAARLRLGLVVVGGTSSVFGAAHGRIFSLDSSTFGLFSLLLLFLLLNTVLVAVCGQVGLGLLRREFRGRRLIRVPIRISLQLSRLRPNARIPLDGKACHARLLC